MHLVTIQTTLQWALKKDRASGNLIATCDPLNIVMSGNDVADLEANIRETLQLMFSSLLRDGEFDKFLRDRGWTATPMPNPEDIDRDGLRFNVPMELVAARAANDPQRALAK